MRRYTVHALMALLPALVLVSSHLLSGSVKGGIAEGHPVLSKEVFTAVPADLRFAFADLGFINTLTFIGYTLERRGGYLTREDGIKIFRSLDAVTTFNPRYFDPYYVANAFLTWETGLYSEAIKLLERGMRYVDDWRIPFYLGFSYFYFLGDNLKGAMYLEEAARRSSERDSNLITLLASRLYYEEGQLAVAIAFLENQLKVMKTEEMKRAVRGRLETLKKALLIKRAVEVFRRRHGRLPRSIEELEREGLIPRGLRDHAGGKFYITADGKVRSERVLFPVRRKLLEEGKAGGSP